MVEGQKESVTPRRQVRVRRTYREKDRKGSSEVVKVAEVGSITEEEEEDVGYSDGSSQSCESLYEFARPFTKDGSPEVCVLPSCESPVADEVWRVGESRRNLRATEPPKDTRACRKPGSSENFAAVRSVRKVQEGKPPAGKNASRAMTVPAALPSTALCGDYGVYQNDAFGSDSSREWDDCLDSASSSSDEDEATWPARPASLLRQLPGCPYDAETVHAVPRTGKRNPLCPFPRRSASPCPARFSSVPPASVPPTFTVEQSPMFNRGESWKETSQNQTPYQFSSPEKHKTSKAWQRNARSKATAGFNKGMSAPPADLVRPKLTVDDRQDNKDIGVFIAAAATANGVKLRDFIKSFSDNFTEVLGPGGLNVPEKKTERKPRPGYIPANTRSRQKDLKIVLERVRMYLPGFGPDRSLDSIK